MISWTLLFYLLIQFTKSLSGSLRGISACPELCRCGEFMSTSLNGMLRTVDCSNIRLDVVTRYGEAYHWSNTDLDDYGAVKYVTLPVFPGNLSSSVEQLKLSSNAIDVLPERSFKNFSALLSLDLSDNKLKELRDNDLEGLTNLLSINLTGNLLKLIKEGAFKHTPNLIHLYLTNNLLYYIHYEWFTSIYKLEQLFLTHNGISDIKNGTFTVLSNLQTLSLADNHLNSLDKDVFSGLSRLEHLDLSANQLKDIPSRAIALLNNLKNLKLDSNSVAIIGPYAFDSLNLNVLTLNNLQNLRVVDDMAFVSLYQLEVLELRRNPRFVYIAPNSIQDVPNLKSLYLNDNQLAAIPRSLIYSTRRLQTLWVHGNPLKCDCNMRWLRNTLEAQAAEAEVPVEQEDDAIDRPAPHRFTVARPQDIVCVENQLINHRLTLTTNQAHLVHIPLASIPTKCPPTIIPLFDNSSNLPLGDSLTLTCRAVGIPEPTITWILPTLKTANSTALHIPRMSVKDAGTYTCSAKNREGEATYSTAIYVHSKKVHLIFKGVATNFVTVTWKNTEDTIYTSNYVILYRKLGTESMYHKVPIQPYMRGYTFTQLSPQTTYEFCIAFDNNLTPSKLNCDQVTTKHNVYMMGGIRSVHNVTIIVTITVCALVICITCIVIAVCRSYCKHRDYKDPNRWGDGYYTSSTGNKDLYSHHIPLDTLFSEQASASSSLQSTPLCTSTTSLISNAKA